MNERERDVMLINIFDYVQRIEKDVTAIKAKVDLMKCKA
jgi:hypothetical protein